jgi:hypothetical protein
MNIIKTRFSALRCCLILGSVVALAACAKVEDHSSFKTPEAAVDALVAAIQKDDVPALQKLLGPGTEDLLSSGDAVQDKADRDDFVARYQQKHSLEPNGTDAMTLIVGDNEWPMPIPIVKKDGKWRLDGAAGADEIVYRRVGANELGAIGVALGFVDAQNEYAAEGRDGDPAGVYALKLISDEGMQNGLYWPTAEGEPASPAGPFVAAAAGEGYRKGADRTPYHGYYYRMLYAQGPNANGGAKEYFANGVLTEGFALVAWPADYGASGVQTFIVNQDGVVFDPDSTWIAVVPQDLEAAGS